MITWCQTCGGPIGDPAKRPEGCRLCWLAAITPRAAFGPASHARWTMDHAQSMATWGPHRELANGRTPVGSVNHYRMAAEFDPIPQGEADPMLTHLAHPYVPPGSDWVPPNARRKRWPPWDVNDAGQLVSPDDEDNRWA